MSDSINRRRFFSTTAATGAAAGLAISGAKSVAAEAANNQIVVGVMGMGRGTELAPEFAKQPGVKVKYVCDVDLPRAGYCAEWVQKNTGQTPTVIGDFRRILDDNEIDALVCSTPNHWHAPATILACAAGKHVYVEKPCSHNPREGELMVAAARKHKRAVQMGTQRRSGPGTIEAMQKLKEGVIGRVYLVRAWYNAVRGSIGNGKQVAVPSHLDFELWQGPAPRRPYVDNLVHYKWHSRWHWGNGELGNNGVHTLDLCRWGMGVDYPTRVTSSGGRYNHRGDDQETPDTHTVCLEFPDDRMITWDGLSCNRHRSGFVKFYGTQGMLELETNGTHRIYDNKSDRPKKVVEHKAVGQPEHIANFIAAIRNDKPLELNAEIEKGHKSTLMCHLGNIAQRTGRSLNCDPKNGHILDDPEAMKLWAREYEPGWEPKV